MRFRRSLLLAGSLFGAVGSPPPAAAADSPQTRNCVQASVEARPRYPGYDHVVHLANRCTVEASCLVSTDVNPQPMAVAIPAGTTVQVLTFMSSPARTFVARIECTMRARG
jgi:hypothetical protein